MPAERPSRPPTRRHNPLMPGIAPTAYIESTLSLTETALTHDNTNPAMIPPAVILSSRTFVAPIEPPSNALGAFHGALHSAAPYFPRPIPISSPAFYSGYNPHVSLNVEAVLPPPRHAIMGHSAPVQAAPVAVQTSTDKNTPVRCLECSAMVLPGGMRRHRETSARHRRAVNARNGLDLQGGFPCEACFQILSRRDAVTRHYPVCDKYKEWLISFILSGPTFASYSPSSSSAGSIPSTSNIGSPASEVAESVPSPSPFTPDQLDIIVRILQRSPPSPPLPPGPSGATMSYAQPALASSLQLHPLTPAGEQLLLGLWILASTPGFENCDAVLRGAGIIVERFKMGKKLGISASKRSKILGHAELIYHRAQRHWLRLRASI